MRRHTTTTLAALALAVLTAGEVRGDTAADPYAGVAVEQLYDSNVQNSKGSDSVTRVTPRIGFLVSGPRLDLDVDYRIGIFEYINDTAPSSLNHRASVVGKAAVSPRFDVDTRLLLVSGEDPFILELPGIAVPLGGYTEFEGHLGAKYLITRRLAFDAAYGYRRSRFDEADLPDPVAFNGDEHRVDAGLGYQMTRRLTLRGFGRYQHFTNFGAPVENMDAAGPGVGLDYLFTGQTFGHADAGPLFTSDGRTTWFGRLHVGHQGERARYSLSGFRDFYGGTGGIDATWTEAVMGQGVFSLTKQLELRMRAGVFRNGFGASEDAAVTGLVGRADLGWKLFRDNMRIELYGEHRAQDAAVGGLAFGDIQRTVVGLRLVAVAGVDIAALGDNP